MEGGLDPGLRLLLSSRSSIAFGNNLEEFKGSVSRGNGKRYKNRKGITSRCGGNRAVWSAGPVGRFDLSR